MSVLTTGKPNGPTRAAAPARQRAGAVDRGQAPGGSRPARRRQERPGPGTVRHLRVVPDTGLPAEVPAGPENGRRSAQGGAVRDAPTPRGASAAREARPVTVPGPRRPGDARPPSGIRGPGDVRRPDAVRQPGDIGRPGDVRRARSSQGMNPGAGVPDTRLAPRRNAVRLTRRGRIVVAVMLTAASLSLVVLAWLAVAARAAQAADGGQPPGTVYQNLTSIVVHPGQTLWSIASQAEPRADPRVVMQQIIDLNALSDTSVEPGQRLWVPRG
jgi:LysM domain-containing protein